MPEPSRTTDFIIVPTLAALDADITRSASSGSGVSTVRPSGSITLATSRGFMRMPPLPIVCATVAICSGVASSRPWPIAVRPTSTRLELIGRILPLRRGPLASICPAG